MSIKKLFLALGLLIFSLEVWSTNDEFLDIEAYKIQNKASGNYLSSNASQMDKSNTTTEIDEQNKHTTYQLWYFEKVGEFYKIRSKANKTCLSGTFETNKGKVFILTDEQEQGEQENKHLWSLKKFGEFYKIKNKLNGAYLSDSSEISNHTPILGINEQDDNTSYSLWYFEKAGGIKTENKSSKAYSDSYEFERDNYRKSIQGEQEKNTIWYDGGCGPCATPTNTYSIGLEGVKEEEIDKYELFNTSVLRGAAYTLVPEIMRDTLVSKGYPQMSNVAATMIQGGMIVYHSSSYIPLMTGMIIKTGCSQLGFSPQVSSTAGSIATILLSLSEKLIFSQETIVESMVDIAIGVAGNYAGSTLALKAKSCIYGLWTSKNSKPVCEQFCQHQNKTC